ncbi:nuclease-related domain-containing protein [Clostridium botulinum]|uniref:nuclease-related domain-containing protein n=1 Tax=Clostridium botulinum TaxID=1491 RepID=UPI000774DF8B|nr:nuclease-related domain-containing protein [Clostridium botulinum]
MEFIGLIILLLLIPRIVNYKMKKEYNMSDYKNESGNTYKEVFDNKGKYGEYLIFKTLENMNKNYKMLTNIYLPKGNGETTEIDLIYIHETGIYVIESKNYSGWIFGDEKNRYWTQTLKSGKKERFYNPIMQNKTHIKYLQKN